MQRDRSIDTATTKETCVHKKKLILRLKEVETRCQQEQTVLYRIALLLFSLNLFTIKHTTIIENIKYHLMCRQCFQKLLEDTCKRHWPEVIQFLLPAHECKRKRKSCQGPRVPGARTAVNGRDFRDKFYPAFFQLCTLVTKEVEPDKSKRNHLKVQLNHKKPEAYVCFDDELLQEFEREVSKLKLNYGTKNKSPAEPPTKMKKTNSGLSAPINNHVLPHTFHSAIQNGGNISSLSRPTNHVFPSSPPQAVIENYHFCPAQYQDSEEESQPCPISFPSSPFPFTPSSPQPPSHINNQNQKSILITLHETEANPSRLCYWDDQ